MRLSNQSQALDRSSSWDLDLLINIIDPWIETDTVCQAQGGKKAQGHTRLIDPKWPQTTRMTPLAIADGLGDQDVQVDQGVSRLSIFNLNSLQALVIE